MNVQQAKALEPGQRVRYTGEGPDFNLKGTVQGVNETEISVRFDDGEESDWKLDRGDWHLRNLELVK